MQIREIAKKLKVSVATISRALNPTTEKMVAPGTRIKIQQYAKKVGFSPNRTARGLSSGKTNTIGVVLPTNFKSIFFVDHTSKTLAGIYNVLEENPLFNCKLIILPKGSLTDNLEQLAVDSGVDGLLLSSLCDHKFSRSHLYLEGIFKKWNKPIVILGLKNDSRYFHNVYSSNTEATRRAITFLIQKGHEKIGLIRGWLPGPPDIEERIQAFTKTLKDHHLEIKSDWIHEGTDLKRESDRFEPPDFSISMNVTGIDYGYRATLELFRRKGEKPTALFCVNDEVAIGALRALKFLKIQCPKDIAVMGFDGLQIGEFIEPKLTTINQPTLQIAETGTRLLLDLLEGKIEGQQIKFVPMDLIIRDSA